MGLGKRTAVKKHKRFQNLSLHSKIAIVTTLILILGGGILIFLFEYDNPLTIGNLSVFDKIQVSLFQSVTTRTAGFATVPQQDLTNASSILCLLLMFIGGSPVGTAGGIKTVTVAVLVVSAIATVQNKQNVSMFNRNISKQMVNKAVAVTLMSFSIRQALSAVRWLRSLSSRPKATLSKESFPYMGINKICFVIMRQR